MKWAIVTSVGLLDMQVCVPVEWTDEQILAFAEGQQPCGTRNGWSVRKEGDTLLQGAPERQPCAERAGMVHVMLDA